MARKEELELLLECRNLELVMCAPKTELYAQLVKEIKYLEQRLSALCCPEGRA